MTPPTHPYHQGLLRFACHFCGIELEVAPELGGETAPCPSCGMMIMAPPGFGAPDDQHAHALAGAAAEWASPVLAGPMPGKASSPAYGLPANDQAPPLVGFGQVVASQPALPPGRAPAGGADQPKPGRIFATSVALLSLAIVGLSAVLISRSGLGRPAWSGTFTAAALESAERDGGLTAPASRERLESELRSFAEEASPGRTPVATPSGSGALASPAGAEKRDGAVAAAKVERTPAVPQPAKADSTPSPRGAVEQTAKAPEAKPAKLPTETALAIAPQDKAFEEARSAAAAKAAAATEPPPATTAPAAEPSGRTGVLALAAPAAVPAAVPQFQASQLAKDGAGAPPAKTGANVKGVAQPAKAESVAAVEPPASTPAAAQAKEPAAPASAPAAGASPDVPEGQGMIPVAGTAPEQAPAALAQAADDADTGAQPSTALERARDAIRKFLESERWQQRVPFIFDGESRQAAIRDYFQSHPDRAVKDYRLDFFHSEAGKEGSPSMFVFFLTLEQEEDGFPVIVKSDRDGKRFGVDWDLHVEFRDRHFARFVEKKEEGAREFRVVIQRVTYWEEDRDKIPGIEGLVCYKVDPPYPGFTQYAFVDKSSEEGKRMVDGLSWETDPLAAKVKMNWAKFPNGRSYLRVTDIVSRSWAE